MAPTQVTVQKGPNFDDLSLSQREWFNGQSRSVVFVTNGNERMGSGIQVVITKIELTGANFKTCEFEGHSLYDVNQKVLGTYDPHARTGTLTLNPSPTAKTVIVRERSDDIHVCVNDDGRYWAAGRSLYDALGNLLSTHRDCFGVVFIGQGKFAGKVGDTQPPATEGAQS
jgi:hypothetical protein